MSIPKPSIPIANGLGCDEADVYPYTDSSDCWLYGHLLLRVQIDLHKSLGSLQTCADSGRLITGQTMTTLCTEQCRQLIRPHCKPLASAAESTHKCFLLQILLFCHTLPSINREAAGPDTRMVDKAIEKDRHRQPCNT